MAPLWSEKHRPASEAAVVVQKKKVAEVRDFLTAGASIGQRVLLLRGPTGCGKAAVLRAISNELDFEVAEWTVAVRGMVQGEVAGVFRESIGDALLRFLATGDRYCTLDASSSASRPRVALVRDFPFTLLDSFGGARRDDSEFLERFHAVLRGGAVQRVAFCFNDTRDEYFAINKLFGPLDPGLVRVVTFDGVPKTFALRALEMVAKAEAVDPAAANAAAISVECGGDLRHAINALQLVSAHVRKTTPAPAAVGRGRKGKGARGLRPPTPQGASSGTNDGSSSQQKSSEDMGLRPTSLGLFHALGRFLWCKRIPPPQEEGRTASAASQPPAAKRRKAAATEGEPRQLSPEQLVPKSSRPPLYYVPEDVLAASNAEPTSVVDWVFTNAPRFFGDVGDLANFAASLADVDAWGDTSQQGTGGASVEALAPGVQVRAMLDANLHPGPPMFADPCGGPAQRSSDSQALSFNMARPLMRDVLRYRQRRSDELAAHIRGLGPTALGGGTAGPSVCIRTLPFVHLMLMHSRGMHPALRSLPYPMMQFIKDLSEDIDHPCFLGGDSDRGSGSLPQQECGPLPADWASALADDPIEG